MKPILRENEGRNFAIQFFSLMVNCADFKSISKIFKMLCICLGYYKEDIDKGSCFLTGLINDNLLMKLKIKRELKD